MARWAGLLAAYSHGHLLSASSLSPEGTYSGGGSGHDIPACVDPHQAGGEATVPRSSDVRVVGGGCKGRLQVFCSLYGRESLPVMSRSESPESSSSPGPAPASYIYHICYSPRMSTSIIKSVTARMIFDSRGNPTVEVRKPAVEVMSTKLSPPCPLALPLPPGRCRNRRRRFPRRVPIRRVDGYL